MLLNFTCKIAEKFLHWPILCSNFLFDQRENLDFLYETFDFTKSRDFGADHRMVEFVKLAMPQRPGFT